MYIGNLGIHGCYAANCAVNACDVLFSIGVRFKDRITGKAGEFAPKATIVHVDIDPASITCMRFWRGCPAVCSAPSTHCQEYTPDFVQLAESYGARGIRVQTADGIRAALQEAQNSRKTATVIEFIIEREANVLPMVPPGNPLNDMILEGENKQ